MAYSSYYYHTELPKLITEEIISTCESYVSSIILSQINDQSGVLTKDADIRSSTHKWIKCDSWISSFIMTYIQKINRHNFMYDLVDFDEDNLQYTIYNQNDFYGWHVDSELQSPFVVTIDRAYSSNHHIPTREEIQSSNLVRKLSFSLLLSDDFTGGELQFHNHNSSWSVEQHLGSLIIFDSTLPHRVTKVKSGTRKSLVGWVLGPRWK